MSEMLKFAVNTDVNETAMGKRIILAAASFEKAKCGYPGLVASPPCVAGKRVLKIANSVESIRITK